MSDLPQPVRDQRKTDADHLKLLVIFHFIGAGLSFLGILFLCIHYAIFRSILNAPGMWQGQHSGPPPAEFFWIFRLFYAAFAIWLIASGVLNLISAFCLRARTHRRFSLVVAVINCTHVPLGTLLGAFTIIVLVRDSVRELYETESRAASSPTSS